MQGLGRVQRLERGDSMAKLSDRQHKAMIARYAETNNFSQVAKEFGVSVNTVKNHCNADENIAHICAQKKEQNTLDMIEFLDSRKSKAQDFLDLAFEYLQDTKKLDKAGLQSIATAMGIVVDKFIQNAPQTDSAQLQKAKDILGGIDGVIE